MTILTSKDVKVQFGVGFPTVIIGERINPTNKNDLANELREGRFDLLIKEAIKQKEAGADILDINVGADGVNEVDILPEAVKVANEITGLPICIDSSDPKAIEKALKIYQYKALINSTTGEDSKLEVILPLAKKYNAAVICLAYNETGISNDSIKRIKVAEKIIEKAKYYKLPIEDIVIDCVALSSGVDSNFANITLETVKKVSSELNISTVLGISNISFGMPMRNHLNLSFLSIAIANGLNAAIIDPTKEGVVETILAADYLTGRDKYGKMFISYYRTEIKGVRS